MMELTTTEMTALYGALADETDDIILKTDRAGVVQQASSAVERMGIARGGARFAPHISAMTDAAHADLVREEHEAALLGTHPPRWIDVPVPVPGDRARWFTMQMRRLADDRGEAYGALCIMRCIDEKRLLEERLFAAELTDPLTGLSNRSAFISMLSHLIEKGTGGCVVLVSIDHLKGINLQHGQSVGDEVLAVFADFLRALLRSDDIISRVSGESFGILLPRATPAQAGEIGRRIMSNLTATTVKASGRLLVSASAGVVRIGGSVDVTLRQAEMALLAAKVKGRNTVEMQV